MELILISAMTRERVIGSRDGLPWSIPEEYEHFLGLVRGHPVVLGRKSYEIFGPDLADSPLLVVSSSVKELSGAQVCPDVSQALELAGTLGDRVFSAGGATIYRQTLPLADAMYLSFVKGRYEGDAFFPEFDESEWRVTRRDDHPEFEFRVYERRREIES
jgi:dihydrofolate reductase